MAFRSSLCLALLLNTFVLAQDESDPPQRIVTAHGVIMAILFAILFPLGSIILKLSKSRSTIWLHAAWQGVSYLGLLAGFGIGVYLATVEDNWVNKQGHAIIGTIVTAFLFLQPLAGYLHHRSYSVYGKTTALGMTHRWNGRVMLLLGVINGGLGLWLSGAGNDLIIPYGVVAGIVYITWAVVAILDDKKVAARNKSADSAMESI